MNNIIKYSFAEWLDKQERLEEAVKERVDLEKMSHIDQVKQLIDTNDIVDLSSERSRKSGQQNLGVVRNVSGQKVTIMPLNDPQKIIEVPLEDIYYLDPKSLPPEEQMEILKDMNKMGQNVKLWQRLTPRQRQMEIRKRQRQERERQQRASQFQSMDTPDSKQVSRSEIERMKSFLFGDQPSAQQQEEDPLSSFFSKQEEEPAQKQPLGDFMRKRRAASDFASRLG